MKPKEEGQFWCWLHEDEEEQDGEMISTMSITDAAEIYAERLYPSCDYFEECSVIVRVCSYEPGKDIFKVDITVQAEPVFYSSTPQRHIEVEK